MERKRRPRQRKPFGVYRDLAKCKAAPNYVRTIMRVHFSSGLKVQFSTSGVLNAKIVKAQFNSKGIPLDPCCYDKRTYRIMRGLYVAAYDATSELLAEVGHDQSKIDRAVLQERINEKLKAWNDNLSSAM